MENTNPTMPPPPQGNPYQQQGNPYGGYQQQQGFGGQIDHPKAGSIQTQGILGLVFTFVIGIVGLILNIICLSSSGSAMRDVNSNPGRYTDASIRKIKSGRTCAIIGLSIQGAALILVLLIVAANA